METSKLTVPLFENKTAQLLIRGDEMDDWAKKTRETGGYLFPERTDVFEYHMGRTGGSP